jgi:peptidylprolyl isomerase
MNRRSTRVLAAVLVATFPVMAVACGDDEDSSSETTTTAAQSASDEFLAEVEARGKPTLEATDPVTELVITDDFEGTGTEVQPGDTVTAHYVGVSASTGQEFDASWTGGQPISFPLDGVIQGWSEGLVGMKEGGRRTLVIPADMAYGDAPPPGSGIAPGETLVFTVDLVAVD